MTIAIVATFLGCLIVIGIIAAIAAHIPSYGEYDNNVDSDSEIERAINNRDMDE